MTGSQARSIVAVKIFIEQNQIPPVGIVLKNFCPAVNWPPAVFPAQENSHQPTRNLRRDFPKRHLPPGTSRKFHCELLAIIKVEALQGLDQQKVRRKPHWPAPIRISSKKRRRRFRRFVIDRVLMTIERQHKGMFLMKLR